MTPVPLTQWQRWGRSGAIAFSVTTTEQQFSWRRQPRICHTTRVTRGGLVQSCDVEAGAARTGFNMNLHHQAPWGGGAGLLIVERTEINVWNLFKNRDVWGQPFALRPPRCHMSNKQHAHPAPKETQP